MPIPNPEQTASLWSLMTYTFLDPIVWLAYRIPHLSHDQLPPLSDYDYAKYLKKQSFPVRAHFLCSVYHVLKTPNSTLMSSREAKTAISSGA